VTVSEIVLDCVVDTEVSVDANRTKAVAAVAVSIVIPETIGNREKVLLPVPPEVVNTVVDPALPAVTATVVGPVSVGAALTIIVTKRRATPPAESVTVIVSRYVFANTFAATRTTANPEAALVVSRVIPALVAIEADWRVNVRPDAPLSALTCKEAVRPTDVLIVEIPPAPASVIPGLTVTVIGSDVLDPNESVAVIVS
jgi:hypothetical protein